MTTPEPAEGSVGVGVPDTDLYGPPEPAPEPPPVTEDPASSIESVDAPGRFGTETEE